MRSEDVIEIAPRATTLGAWLAVAGLYASGPTALILFALAAIIGFVSLGALLAHYPS